MATTNYDRVGRALDLLRGGLRPFLEREPRTRWARRGHVGEITVPAAVRGGCS